MSSILFPSNITLNAIQPLDSRQVVSNEAARLALKYAYPGLAVFEESTQKIYVAKRSESENSALDWEEITANPVKHGHFFNGAFYTDTTYSKIITPDIRTIYIDDNNNGNSVYIYNKKLTEAEYHYICINPLIPNASETEAGIMKIYGSLGSNVDGACNQKVVTDALNEKFSVAAETASECLIFTK